MPEEMFLVKELDLRGAKRRGGDEDAEEHLRRDV